MSRKVYGEEEHLALTDPTGLEAFAADSKKLVAIALENPSSVVIDALIERLHGTRRRFFWSAALAVRARRGLAAMREHLGRILSAPDRETSLGRQRIERVLRCFETERALQPHLRELLAAEQTPGIAVDLIWSLVHGARDAVATTEAIVEAVRRLGGHDKLRREAARALSYCDEAARAPALRQFLLEIPAAEKRRFSAYARVLAGAKGE